MKKVEEVEKLERINKTLEDILKQVTIIESSEIERIAIFNKYGTLRIYLKDGEVIDARII